MCAGTCTLVPVSTRRTRPANGAVSDVSIFIDSTTATTSPSATSSPSPTGIATTTDGPWLAHEAAVVAGDAVRHAVDLDQQVGALAGDHRAVRVAADA